MRASSRSLAAIAAVVAALAATAAADPAADMKKKREEIDRAHAELLRRIQDDGDGGDRRAFDDVRKGLEWVKGKAPSGGPDRVWAEKYLDELRRLDEPFAKHLEVHALAAETLEAVDAWTKAIRLKEKELAAELAAIAAAADGGAATKARLDQHRQKAKSLGAEVESGPPAARDLDRLESLHRRVVAYSGGINETRAIASKLRDNAGRTLAAATRKVADVKADLAPLAKGPDHQAWRDGYAKVEGAARKDAAGDAREQVTERAKRWIASYGSRLETALVQAKDPSSRKAALKAILAVHQDWKRDDAVLRRNPWTDASADQESAAMGRLLEAAAGTLSASIALESDYEARVKAYRELEKQWLERAKRIQAIRVALSAKAIRPDAIARAKKDMAAHHEALTKLHLKVAKMLDEASDPRLNPKRDTTGTIETNRIETAMLDLAKKQRDALQVRYALMSDGDMFRFPDSGPTAALIEQVEDLIGPTARDLEASRNRLIKTLDGVKAARKDAEAKWLEYRRLLQTYKTDRAEVTLDARGGIAAMKQAEELATTYRKRHAELKGMLEEVDKMADAFDRPLLDTGMDADLHGRYDIDLKHLKDTISQARRARTDSHDASAIALAHLEHKRSWIGKISDRLRPVGGKPARLTRYSAELALAIELIIHPDKLGLVTALKWGGKIVNECLAKACETAARNVIADLDLDAVNEKYDYNIFFTFDAEYAAIALAGRGGGELLKKLEALGGGRAELLLDYVTGKLVLRIFPRLRQRAVKDAVRAGNVARVKQLLGLRTAAFTSQGGLNDWFREQRALAEASRNWLRQLKSSVCDEYEPKLAGIKDAQADLQGACQDIVKRLADVEEAIAEFTESMTLLP